MLSVVSQTQLFLCCWATELVWSEPDSVDYTESPSYIVDQRAVYILWRSGSVPVPSLGRLVDPADSSESPGESRPEGEVPEHHWGREGRIVTRARYSPVLSKGAGSYEPVYVVQYFCVKFC